MSVTFDFVTSQWSLYRTVLIFKVLISRPGQVLGRSLESVGRRKKSPTKNGTLLIEQRDVGEVEVIMSEA